MGQPKIKESLLVGINLGPILNFWGQNRGKFLPIALSQSNPKCPHNAGFARWGHPGIAWENQRTPKGRRTWQKSFPSFSWGNASPSFGSDNNNGPFLASPIKEQVAGVKQDLFLLETGRATDNPSREYCERQTTSPTQYHMLYVYNHRCGLNWLFIQFISCTLKTMSPYISVKSKVFATEERKSIRENDPRLSLSDTAFFVRWNQTCLLVTISNVKPHQIMFQRLK